MTDHHVSRFAPRPFGGRHDDDEEPQFRKVLEIVRMFMISHIGQWLSAKEIRQGCGLDEDVAVTARLRDLRKPQFGGWSIECRRMSGVYRYRLQVRKTEAA